VSLINPERLYQLLPAIYRLRDALTAAMAERFDPADMPRERRHRTRTQEAVTNCPRCGLKIEEEEVVKA